MKTRITFVLTALLTLMTFASNSLAQSHGHLQLTVDGGKLKIVPDGTRTLVSGFTRLGLPASQVYNAGLPTDTLFTNLVSPGTFSNSSSLDNDFQSATFTVASDAFATQLGAGNFYFQMYIFQRGGGATSIDGAQARLTSATTIDLTHFAQTDGVTQLDQSFAVPVSDLGSGIFQGTHLHGQNTFIGGPGLFEIAYTAWDASGTYAPADPVFFNVSVPEPSSIGLLAIGAIAILRRRARR